MVTLAPAVTQALRMAGRLNTPASLVLRLRDCRDREAWERFVGLYAPLIYGYGRRRGLQDADAADLTQAVLHAVLGSIARYEYDPAKARFHTWFFRVVRNQFWRQFAHRFQSPAEEQGPEAEALLRGCADHGNEHEAAEWEQEYRRGRFRWAVDQVRGGFEESSWRAFWHTAVDGRPAPDVASELGLSVGAVYTAKSRVLDRIRRVIDTVQDD
jgi:RNA polymerase sigma-70 factor (ECF subfamily)